MLMQLTTTSPYLCEDFQAGTTDHSELVNKCMQYK